MVDILYAVIAFFTAIVMAILYFYTNRLLKESDWKRQIKQLFMANVLLSLVDTVWGSVGAGLPQNYYAYNVVTIAYFIMSAIVMYMWVVSSLKYIKCRFTSLRKVLLIAPLALEIVLVLLNPFTHMVFSIDTVEWKYVGAYGQVLFFVFNVMYLLLIMHATARKMYICKDRFVMGRYKVVILYTFVLVFTCLTQNVFERVPFASMGCLIAAAILFMRNIVVDEKQVLVDSNIYFENTSKEIYSAFEALSGSYVSIHIINLKNDTFQTVKSNAQLDRIVKEGESGSSQIKLVMENVTEPDYTEKMVEFVDLSTLSERMRGKERIFHEFLGKNVGWCVATFIRIDSDKDGNPTRVIHSVQDINDVKIKELEYDQALKEALKNQNTIYEEMLRAQSNGVMAVKEDGEIIYINEAGVRLTGYHDLNKFPKNITTCMDNIEVLDPEEFLIKKKAFLEEHKTIENEYSVNLDGKKLFISANAKQIELNDGRNIYIVSLFDITKGKSVEAELKILSETDALTAIDNRRSGEQKIESMMENEISGMLCILDVNKFKGINDTYGHQIGDVVLQKVAESIKRSFRESDVVMRLGGDEFAVYAKELTDANVCAKCMEKLFKNIEEISIPEHEKLKPTISAGIAFYDGKKKCAYSRLYQQADSVMYMSKGKGGNSFTIFRMLR